ncbi:E2F/DP family winged-helix DNA-binding domain-domain-containing protein [Absidia repens]|uniref:E2F/DP family winged-helix DNA-binding domain-domain-containing protein n=1 Tax=Absidia repens TaxID=90262 RepID=A0A1X2I5C5_9FUNG|nr:E2F/DP family winged-helix DNA-binding domain-domain-containing protein [Absidia repens]
MCEWLPSPPNDNATSYFHAKTPSPPSHVSICPSNLTQPMIIHESNHHPLSSSYFSLPPTPLSSSTSTSSTSSVGSSPTSSPRKGSIASLLNSINELQKLDQEELSTNYQTHFTTDGMTTPMMMDDVEGDEDDASFSSTAAATTQPTSTPTHFAYGQNKKGLRLFSQHVCDILQQKGVVTYNELVQQLMDELDQSSETTTTSTTTTTKRIGDPKNIRRRVYDALNVLMAINFITKDKKEIRWIGSDDYYYGNHHHTTAVAAATVIPTDSMLYQHDPCTDSTNNNMEVDDYIGDDNIMIVVEDIQREEQRYQELTRIIDLKRKEIESQFSNQQQHPSVPTTRHDSHYSYPFVV